MKSEDQIEAHLQKNAQAIQELTIQNETLNRDVNDLLTQLNVSPAQLTTFIENQENFSEDDWKILLEQKKALDEKLLRELLNIRNPKKTKKAFKEMNVKPHWLFVR